MLPYDEGVNIPAVHPQLLSQIPLGGAEREALSRSAGQLKEAMDGLGLG